MSSRWSAVRLRKGEVDQRKVRGTFRPPNERLSVRWLCGTPPKPPKGLLQVLGQSREALAAQNHTDMFPAAADHDEVIEQMGKRLPCNHHAQIVGMSKVGPILRKAGPYSRAPATDGR